MPGKKLADALQSVDWNANVKDFLKDQAAVATVASAGLRVAIWALQFEKVDKGNPALSFVREMQVACQHVAALLALGLYKSAASSMRSAFETALYYTYFRSHPSELSTLTRNPAYFASKQDLLAYHKDHTKDFSQNQTQLGLLSKIDRWYSSVSAIIHGQVPGKWIEHSALAEIKFSKTTLSLAVKAFTEGEEVIHHLFLCTVGRELWDGFSPEAKGSLISGLKGDAKTVLGLDKA